SDKALRQRRQSHQSIGGKQLIAAALIENSPGGKVHGQRKEKHKEHVDVSPAPLPNHADGGCQDGACDEADSSADEIAPDGIRCDNHSQGPEGAGTLNGPSLPLYG